MSTPPTDRVALASWPTPMEAAPRLAAEIGLRADGLWLKRDDLTGLAAGGNKIRKLEWTLAAALAEGADTVVTTGAPQSNHARLTAAAAARLGLRAVLVFPGAPASGVQGNLLLDGLLGATIVWTGDVAGGHEALGAAAASTADELREQGRHPVIIPFGGSNAVGAQGYRLAGREIAGQRPDCAHVVCAVGSGGTMAGLVAALGAHRVLGVHTGAVPDARAQVAALLADMGESTVAEDLRIREDQVGSGYEALTATAAEALRLAARTEGLVLDPTYTARALAGLVAEIEDGTIGAADEVVFLASGGLPGLFGHPRAASLVE
ncbi:D-cysteine desulfhydrase [Mycolicibacterium madagascariense]|uniref:D-cysteine desulfhydrase n=1 Tax=Mycolicibacterium madagascariense TaxID=212765 RepID=A0A7I7XI03_9MYCO|nr:pyridoxal-phosphate dependent enzyme [Mycolicibacterium madagascariense]MCV7015798.1 pyridoxal-phosphate dependent enzyme [Mycolicibacterium madagascariense]BBZ28836.1 D-cysteine desulfhydrase [Mycolicibacterium madagascariense]